MSRYPLSLWERTSNDYHVYREDTVFGQNSAWSRRLARTPKFKRSRRMARRFSTTIPFPFLMFRKLERLSSSEGNMPLTIRRLLVKASYYSLVFLIQLPFSIFNCFGQRFYTSGCTLNWRIHLLLANNGQVDNTSDVFKLSVWRSGSTFNL